MATPDSTAPAFDGTRNSMFDMGLQPFGDWWSNLPAGAQVGLVLGFLAVMTVVVWWAIRHERRHTSAPRTSRRPKGTGPGRSSRPGS